MLYTIQDLQNIINTSKKVPSISNEISELLHNLEKKIKSYEHLQNSENNNFQLNSSNHKNFNISRYENSERSVSTSTLEAGYGSYNFASRQNKWCHKNSKTPNTITNNFNTYSNNVQYNNIRKNENANTSTTDETWTRTEIIADFKTTKLEKKEGIEKKINEIRILLNKISQKNYETIKNNIFELIENILKERNEIIEIPIISDVSYTITESELNIELYKVSQFIFDIASTNKFFSEIYANLYKELNDKYSIFKEILNIFIFNFKDSIQYFSYCDPNENYDKYCNFVKDSDKKKSTTTFIIMLLNRSLISLEIVIELIDFFKNIILNYIDTPNKTNEVDEIIEIVYILISLGKFKLQNHDTWKELIKPIYDISNMKIKEHISISTRSIFKLQSLFERSSTTIQLKK
jgi:hypothetical protein